MIWLSLHSKPPPGWHDVCASESALFHSEAWQRLLERSFKCRTLYAWDTANLVGAAVTVFAAGPFQIGYVGFPSGGAIGGTLLSSDVLKRLIDAERHRLPVCLRIPVSAFADKRDLSGPCQTSPETAISDLPSWTSNCTSSNVRRDLRKASRSEVVIGDAEDQTTGSALYDIYRSTISRHSGSLRYPSAYFSELIRFRRNNPALRVLVVHHRSEIAGFAVFARHAKTGFYLHGGMNLRFRDARPMAPLMYEGIRWAREIGCETFNFMSSPADQPSLVHYKEKWGAETRVMETYTEIIRPSYYLFRAAEKIQRRLFRSRQRDTSHRQRSG